MTMLPSMASISPISSGNRIRANMIQKVVSIHRPALSTAPVQSLRLTTSPVDNRLRRPSGLELRYSPSQKFFSSVASRIPPSKFDTAATRLTSTNGDAFQNQTPSRCFSSTTTTSTTSTAPTPPPLVSKVLIANRGEISIRVAQTCRRLGIPTVAVYVGNDAHSKHVTHADESVCLGPDGSAYTDKEALLKAIQTTKADAVHPGYGFLSENDDFSKAVQEAGIVWLGPPAQAIEDMGCKLRSKEIAHHAGVAIIPGCGNVALESVDQALELLQDPSYGLEYPVLLKAAAGGGGKGMRICRNEQELREGFPLATSEGLKFFADGRLLLEQYLENPHHIEFQVICSKRTSNDTASEPAVDVAIFAERECSVQRRNQKVVEESPSCLLTEETRREMMEQTALLCQTVGYEGAGTVEWLVVDANSTTEDASQARQKFFFLEMNTRLQVEHPVTEAVSHNVDLVAAMLDVGSGRGLPSEWYETAEIVETSNTNEGQMLIMPWKGHSIEGRIYAEDPLRGYLPSTGPLVPYKEPAQAVAFHKKSSSSTSYLRLDSGVVEGHVVTPFYDPMLSKIISYAPTREEAIEVLSEGLDSYVIEGVQHNAKLVQAVLRHPSFQIGRTPTSFLEEEIPDFSEYRYHEEPHEEPEESSGSLLSALEEEELAAAVALISKSRQALLGRPPVVGSNNDGSQTVVVRLDGLFGDTDAFSVTLAKGETEAHVTRMTEDGNSGSATHRVIPLGDILLDLEGYLAHLSVDGTERTIQVLNERHSGELKVQMHGAEYSNCLVQSPKEYQLSKHMLPPLVEDTSNFVMSPMPGTLIGFSKGVSVGDTVEEGQELCVVEAMKMQNILRAPRAGIISKLCVETGAALVTDQVILEFESEDEEEGESAA